MSQGRIEIGMPRSFRGMPCWRLQVDGRAVDVDAVLPMAAGPHRMQLQAEGDFGGGRGALLIEWWLRVEPGRVTRVEPLAILSFLEGLYGGRA